VSLLSAVLDVFLSQIPKSSLGQTRLLFLRFFGLLPSFCFCFAAPSLLSYLLFSDKWADPRGKDEATPLADLFIPQITSCTRERLVDMLPNLNLGSRARPALIVVRGPELWTLPLDRDLFDESICISEGQERILSVFDRDGRVLLRPSFEVEPYPADLACSLQSPEKIKETFDRFGLVVVDNVLSANECEATVDEIWKTLLDQSDGSLRRDDASTWDRWPRQGAQFGIIGMGTLRLLEPQACRNRAKAYEAFRAVLRDDELITNVTRGGCMRPTRDVWMGDGVGTVQRPEWASLTDWVHIDMNPFTGQVSSFGFSSTGTQSQDHGFSEPWMARAAFLHANGPDAPAPAVQAILAVADCPTSVGGFHAIPCFHRFAQSWAVLHAHSCLTANSSLDPSTIQVPESDPLRAHVQKIPLRAGSLLIWNSLLPHGNFPNTGTGPAGAHAVQERCRYVQYMHMARASDPYLLPYPLAPSDLPLPQSDHTPLLRRLYGFEPWPSAAARARFQVYQEALREAQTALSPVVSKRSKLQRKKRTVSAHDNPNVRDLYHNLMMLTQQRLFTAMLEKEGAAAAASAAYGGDSRSEASSCCADHACSSSSSCDPESRSIASSTSDSGRAFDPECRSLASTASLESLFSYEGEPRAPQLHVHTHSHAHARQHGHARAHLADSKSSDHKHCRHGACTAACDPLLGVSPANTPGAARGWSGLGSHGDCNHDDHTTTHGEHGDAHRTPHRLRSRMVCRSKHPCRHQQAARTSSTPCLASAGTKVIGPLHRNTSHLCTIPEDEPWELEHHDSSSLALSLDADAVFDLSPVQFPDTVRAFEIDV
jgi:hypothetical protein